MREDIHIKEIFRQAELSGSIDLDKKSASIQCLKCSVKDKRTSYHISKLEIIKNQIKYMDKTVVLSQMICLLLFLAIYLFFQNQTEEKSFFIFGSAVASLLGIFVAAGSRQNLIAELAESCFFNNKQIFILRMILYGSFDLILLFILMLFVNARTESSYFTVGIYLLIPFILSCCCYFGILMTEMGRRNNYLLIGMGILLGAVSGILSSYPQVYEKAGLAVWYVILLIGVVLLVAEVWYLFYKIEKGDILCMN